MPRPKSQSSELPLFQNEPGMLAEVPAVIHTQGRVAGYEYLRDRLLTDWERFIARGVNPYSALKLIIEMDRHAMFADVQAEKRRGQFDMEAWKNFQSYLHGEVDTMTEEEIPTEVADNASSPSYDELLIVRDSTEDEEEENA